MVLPWQPNRGSFELASIAMRACPVVVVKSPRIFQICINFLFAYVCTLELSSCAGDPIGFM